MATFSIALDRAIPDFRISKGRLVLSHGADCARDRLFLGLSMNTGDWYLDQADGLPWYPDETEAPSILGGSMSDAEVAARIRRRTLQDPEIRAVNSLNISRVGARDTLVTIEAKTTQGDSLTVEI